MFDAAAFRALVCIVGMPRSKCLCGKWGSDRCVCSSTKLISLGSMEQKTKGSKTKSASSGKTSDSQVELSLKLQLEKATAATAVAEKELLETKLLKMAKKHEVKRSSPTQGTAPSPTPTQPEVTAFEIP